MARVLADKDFTLDEHRFAKAFADPSVTGFPLLETHTRTVW
jgi:hypothetical protein